MDTLTRNGTIHLLRGKSSLKIHFRQHAGADSLGWKNEVPGGDSRNFGRRVCIPQKHYRDISRGSQNAIELTAGREYDVRQDYVENGGDAVARLGWTRPTTLAAEAPAIAREADEIIAVMRISPQVEIESGDNGISADHYIIEIQT